MRSKRMDMAVSARCAVAGLLALLALVVSLVGGGGPAGLLRCHGPWRCGPMPSATSTPVPTEAGTDTPTATPTDTGTPTATPVVRIGGWAVVGDSITCMTLGGVGCRPSGSQAGVVGLGTSGQSSAGAVISLTAYLDEYPTVRFWGLAEGTNDAWQRVPTETYAANLSVLVEMVEAAGGVAVVARVPWNAGVTAPLGAYVAVDDEVRVQFGLAAGPDLYGWFASHPEQLDSGGVHPNAAGQAAIRAMWAADARESGWVTQQR